MVIVRQRPVIRREAGYWRVTAPPYTDSYLIEKAIQWAINANRVQARNGLRGVREGGWVGSKGQVDNQWNK